MIQHLLIGLCFLVLAGIFTGLIVAALHPEQDPRPRAPLWRLALFWLLYCLIIIWLVGPYAAGAH